MPNKILRLDFQKNADVPTTLTIDGGIDVIRAEVYTGDNDKTAEVAPLAQPITLTLTEAQSSIDVFVNVPELTEELLEAELPSTALTFTVSGETVYLSRREENYAQQSYDDATLTGYEGFSHSRVTIVEEPTFNGEPDLNRYDFSKHIPGGGDLGPGVVEMRDGETVVVKLQYSYYTDETTAAYTVYQPV